MFDFYVFICLLGFYASLAIRFLFYADAKKKVVEKNHVCTENCLNINSIIQNIFINNNLRPHCWTDH